MTKKKTIIPANQRQDAAKQLRLRYEGGASIRGSAADPVLAGTGEDGNPDPDTGYRVSYGYARTLLLEAGTRLRPRIRG